MNTETSSYLRVSSRARLEKSVNSLLGLIEGIAIDGSVNEEELKFLRLWLGENTDVRNRHPYNELIPIVEDAIGDGVLSEEERQDIVWLCERLRASKYFDSVTADIQRLHALMAGIASDGAITEAELRSLADWLSEHEHLKTCWPYDEVDSLITAVLKDGRVDENEHSVLVRFFTEFVSVLDDRTVSSPLIVEAGTIRGLCASCPTVSFENSLFCFTGAFSNLSRSELTSIVRTLGGEVTDSVSKKIQYLVIGAEGNPAWAYACYGRKVEKAVELRKQGARIVLVHEHDFKDAMVDCGR